jgi:hypothetical protein
MLPQKPEPILFQRITHCFCQAKIAAFDHQESRQWGEKGKRVIVENRGI